MRTGLSTDTYMDGDGERSPLYGSGVSWRGASGLPFQALLQEIARGTIGRVTEGAGHPASRVQARGAQDQSLAVNRMAEITNKIQIPFVRSLPMQKPGHWVPKKP
jgi:hypothetical protein